ncbi:LOW QUALITY PROTEIN: hypothetical protein IFM47457_03205 [Aspergillus lentulus]|nr:LOW QUALITY PROTEIN: hypothetical protein IFM47457_03205 [Aspergillus lentulus]
MKDEKMRETIRDKDEVCKAVSCSSHGGSSRVQKKRRIVSIERFVLDWTGLWTPKTAPDASEAP